jgi:hypothetical protein
MLPPHGTNGHFFTDIPAPRKPQTPRRHGTDTPNAP